MDEYFIFGLNRRTRTIYLGSTGHDEDVTGWESGVDYKLAGNVIKSLELLDGTSSSDIKLIINNPGGNEYHMFGIYDAIKQCRSEVTGVVLGHAMSAGSVILQACDHRLMAPHAWLMLHYGDYGYQGHDKDFGRAAEHVKKIDKQMEDIYLERIRESHPKFTRKHLQNRISFDWYLDAEETIKMGLADNTWLG